MKVMWQKFSAHLSFGREYLIFLFFMIHCIITELYCTKKEFCLPLSMTVLFPSRCGTCISQLKTSPQWVKMWQKQKKHQDIVEVQVKKAEESFFCVCVFSLFNLKSTLRVPGFTAAHVNLNSASGLFTYSEKKEVKHLKHKSKLFYHSNIRR